MKITPCASQKTLSITFSAECCVCGCFGTFLPGLTHCFWPFTWFRSIVVDPCFIHRYKTTQKFFRIAVKIGKILLQSGHPNVFLVDWEQSQHPSCTEPSHAEMWMQNIDHTLSWDGYDLSYLTHIHFRVIQNKIMNFIDHIWCSDLI